MRPPSFIELPGLTHVLDRPPVTAGAVPTTGADGVGLGQLMAVQKRRLGLCSDTAVVGALLP